MREIWTDEDMLMALHLHANEGMTAKQIGERFGRRKGSVIGMMNRVAKETDKHDLTPHLNGTMKPLWWRR